jgi:hypothetical protein
MVAYVMEKDKTLHIFAYTYSKRLSKSSNKQVIAKLHPTTKGYQPKSQTVYPQVVIDKVKFYTVQVEEFELESPEVVYFITPKSELYSYIKTGSAYAKYGRTKFRNQEFIKGLECVSYTLTNGEFVSIISTLMNNLGVNYSYEFTGDEFFTHKINKDIFIHNNLLLYKDVVYNNKKVYIGYKGSDGSAFEFINNNTNVILYLNYQHELVEKVLVDTETITILLNNLFNIHTYQSIYNFKKLVTYKRYLGKGYMNLVDEVISFYIDGDILSEKYKGKIEWIIDKFDSLPSIDITDMIYKDNKIIIDNNQLLKVRVKRRIVPIKIGIDTLSRNLFKRLEKYKDITVKVVYSEDTQTIYFFTVIKFGETILISYSPFLNSI